MSMRVLAGLVLFHGAISPAFGQYYDGETGSNYNYARYYEMSTGRYATADPIGLRGGGNPYLYASAGPVGASDRFGLWPINGHDYQIGQLNNFGLGISSGDLGEVMAGSAFADSPRFQTPEYSFMHAMSSSRLSKEAAHEQWCKFVSDKVRYYRELRGSDDPRMRRLAYFNLGMGLHAVMDSTSPSHAGFQYWGGWGDATINWYIVDHGDTALSPENFAAAKSAAFETAYLMVRTMGTGTPPDCECQR